jgi:hypothetical protein
MYHSAGTSMKTSFVAMILWLAPAGALDNGGYFPIKTKAGDRALSVCGGMLHQGFSADA